MPPAVGSGAVETSASVVVRVLAAVASARSLRRGSPVNIGHTSDRLQPATASTMRRNAARSGVAAILFEHLLDRARIMRSYSRETLTHIIDFVCYPLELFR